LTVCQSKTRADWPGDEDAKGKAWKSHKKPLVYAQRLERSNEAWLC
jgi:hypothetical protein